MRNPTTKITHAILDLDPIYYAGASAVEKTSYRWLDSVTNEPLTDWFSSAKEAKEWVEEQTFLGFAEESDFSRETKLEIGSEEEAIKATQSEIEKYQKVARDLSKNPDIKFIGYVTHSTAQKMKDSFPLEKQYQHNREGVVRPTHYKACKSYVHQTCDWAKMSPKGFEADAPCIATAEKYGYKAVLMSIDKDLAEAMEVNFINMNRHYKPKIIKTGKLGEMWWSKTPSGEEKLNASGRKMTFLLALAGDLADGYSGCKGVGPKTVYNLLKELETEEECLGIMAEVVKKKYGEEFTYTSFEDKGVDTTYVAWLDLLINVAYQPRTKTDFYDTFKMLEGTSHEPFCKGRLFNVGV